MPPNAVRINQLFSISLTCSILAAFGALFGQQWLVYYKKRSGGGIETERWERERKLLGAWRWRLQPIVEMIFPGILQIAVFIFGIGLIDFLGILNWDVAFPNLILACIGVSCYLISSILALWDPYCPFQTSFPKLLVSVLRRMRWIGPLIGRIATMGLKGGYTLLRWGEGDIEWLATTSWTRISGWLAESVSRRDSENIDLLQASAISRLLQTSEDEEAVRTAAQNLLLIELARPLTLVATNPRAMDTLRKRFVSSLLDSNQNDMNTFARATTHVWVLTGHRPISSSSRGVDWYYHQLFVVKRAAQGYVSDVDSSKPLPSSAEAVVLVHLIQAGHDYETATDYVDFLERSVPLATYPHLTIGLIACYLLWTPGYVAEEAWPRLKQTLDLGERPQASNACERMSAMYQRFNNPNEREWELREEARCDNSHESFLFYQLIRGLSH